eukprot:2828407-Rhodomonas_salina.5
MSGRGSNRVTQAHVRMVDRYTNERSRARWEDFVLLNVTRTVISPDSHVNVRVFEDVGCFDGTYLCSSDSQLAPALNVESLGYSVTSQVEIFLTALRKFCDGSVKSKATFCEQDRGKSVLKRAPVLNWAVPTLRQRDAGETVWLHAVSFVGTVSGSYRVEIKHGKIDGDKTTKTVENAPFRRRSRLLPGTDAARGTARL